MTKTVIEPRVWFGETVELDGAVKTPPLALRDTFRTVHPDEKRVGTFHGFKGPDYVYNNVNKIGNKIDYIFVTSGSKQRTPKSSGRKTTSAVIRRTITRSVPS